MDFIIPNLRLAELVAVVNANRQFFDDFLEHIHEAGYANPHAFVSEPSDEKALRIIAGFLRRSSGVALLDGHGRPFANAIALWYLLACLLRDARAQPEAVLSSLKAKVPVRPVRMVTPASVEFEIAQQVAAIIHTARECKAPHQ